MHEAVDHNRFLQFIVLALAGAFGFLCFVRSAASRFFAVYSDFDSSAAADLPSGNMASEVSDSCAVCGLVTTKHCAGCKMVKYCSGACQKSHWASEHKAKCKDLQSIYKANHTKSSSMLKERKASVVRAGGRSKILKQSNKILFPYEQFVDLFNWDKPDYPPCGLLNCGNSCFANVVLQCLAYTRPLAAYLLEKGHRIECQMDNWCFLCEFQTHVERASRTRRPFSPMNILSRLPNIGGNLGHGEQEDAHEFMRFAIDTMQSVCLDEFGGEKAVHPSYQETTLIQHIFGGHLQSQVICTECNNISNQFENMMDLSVEIHGDAESLEECLDQFTAKECLQGDNMYKCDGCNAYVKAWKRLTVRRAPNILTIALKRFQSGRFGKLNKRVTFPETLDLSPYTSELENGNEIYKLYAVIVHLDMLNASYFGHYICFIKGFCGNWYRIDDCKVATVDLDEVLSQGAYMLMYKRNCARASCLLPAENQVKEENEKVKLQVDPLLNQTTECSSSSAGSINPVESDHVSNGNHSAVEVEVNCNDEENGSGVIDGKHLVSNSLIDNISKQLDLEHTPVSDVGNGSKTDANEGVLRMSSTEESSENEKNNDNSNVSDTNIEVLENENGEFGNIVDAAKKSNGETKLKPVFARGFLGKTSRKEFIKVVDHNNQTITERREARFCT